MDLCAFKDISLLFLYNPLKSKTASVSKCARCPRAHLRLQAWHELEINQDWGCEGSLLRGITSPGGCRLLGLSGRPGYLIIHVKQPIAQWAAFCWALGES